MAQRYLTAEACALIADALDIVSPEEDAAEALRAELADMFRARTEPGAGAILTIPGGE